MRIFACHLRAARLVPAFLCASLLVACGSKEPDSAAADDVISASEGGTYCAAGGSFRVDTYGAIATSINWSPATMSCEGMPRPNQQGARLRFAGVATSASAASNLAFIISIPDLREGATDTELVSRVTLIEEDAGRFFSSSDSEICWTDIGQQTPKLNEDGEKIAGQYRISGLLYCVAPLAETNGTASVTLSDLTFSGQLSWMKPR